MGTPFSTRRYGAWVGKSKSHAVFQAGGLFHCLYAILWHFQSLIRHGKKQLRTKMRHSLTLNVTGTSRRIGRRSLTSPPRPESSPRRGSAPYLRRERAVLLRCACGRAPEIHCPG